jgi:hypothetical protein
LISHLRLGELFVRGDRRINGPAHDAGILFFGIMDDAGFMVFFAGEADSRVGWVLFCSPASISRPSALA